MAISKKEVRYIAKLARLEFTKEEEDILAKDLSKVLDYMAKLNEVDTTDVPPMTHVLDLAGVTRPDQTESRITQEDALRNAPESDGTFFRVPKVIG